jgi:hypothetical protein
MTWSQSSHDLAQPWRTEDDLAHLQKSLQFQWEQGADDAPFAPHGMAADSSLVQMAKALDAARLAQGHGDAGVHTHDGATHSHDELGWPDPRSLEHADERTDAHRHDWGAGRSWKEGDPIPAPIVSSLPVRSRTAGRWDGDGM